MKKILFTLFLLLSFGASAFSLREVDTQVVAANPANAVAYVSGSVPSGSPYLLGRNLGWGAMYAPRWQLGAGRALRINMAADQFDSVRKAWLAEKAGSDSIQDNGYVPFVLPSQYNYTATEAEISQAAAFYLSEACSSYKALNQYPFYEVGYVTSSSERNAVKTDLVNAIGWLTTKQSVLQQADASAPNRLLFDALAFYSCGQLANLSTNYPVFVEAALSLFSNGVFVEGGGADTHYQAVAINQGIDLVLSGYSNSALETALVQAARWYLPRIDAAGVIHSAGNTRTCWAGEEVLGVPKKMSPLEVWRALMYVGSMANDAELTAAAGRVANWINTQPADTCVL